MIIEDEIFKKTRLNEDKILSYGFKKEGDLYLYSETILNNSFRVDIKVDKEGKVKGRVIELEFNEEYKNFRIESATGEFVSLVRDEFTRILKDIREKAFDKSYFIGRQANRIAKLIYDKYKDLPDYPFNDDDISAVFRNPINEKWYGLIMNIKKSKLDFGDEKVDILDLKLDEKKIKDLINQKGFYKAYHMNKEKWITIILDDTLKDEEVMKYIIESHEFTEAPNEWLVPANPNYYDIVNCFNNTDILDWKQSNNIKVNDIVYLYVGSPYKEIMYKCRVIEVNIPYQYEDKNLIINKLMKLKLLKKYKNKEYPFEMLKEYGITAIRGPRGLTESFSKLINKKEK